CPESATFGYRLLLNQVGLGQKIWLGASFCRTRHASTSRSPVEARLPTTPGQQWGACGRTCRAWNDSHWIRGCPARSTPSRSFRVELRPWPEQSAGGGGRGGWLAANGLRNGCTLVLRGCAPCSRIRSDAWLASLRQTGEETHAGRRPWPPAWKPPSTAPRPAV